MAKVKDVFGTGLSGKIGKVVYFQRRGKTFVRSIPVVKKDNASASQLRCRKRFKTMQQFCLLFKFVVIPQIWNLACKTLTGHQLFLKTNKGAFDLDGNLIDLKLIRLSTGKLELPGNLKTQPVGGGSAQWSVSWAKDPYLSGVPYWEELMVISSGQGNFSGIHPTGIRRGDNGGVFDLPDLSCPATHLFFFFVSLDRRNYSESVCLEVNTD